MKSKSYRRRNNGIRIPVAIVAGAIPGIARTITHWGYGGWSPGTREMGRIYLGYDWWTGKFDPMLMIYGSLPLLLGFLAHRILGRQMGLNRTLARMGIPLIRV